MSRAYDYKAGNLEFSFGGSRRLKRTVGGGAARAHTNQRRLRLKLA